MTEKCDGVLRGVKFKVGEGFDGGWICFFGVHGAEGVSSS